MNIAVFICIAIGIVLMLTSMAFAAACHPGDKQMHRMIDFSFLTGAILFLGSLIAHFLIG